MAQRSIATSYRAPTYDVCVVGQELTLDIYREVPGGAEYFEVLGTPPIDVTLICPSNQAEKPQKGVKLPLNQSAGIVVSPRRVSAALYDMKVRGSLGISGASAPERGL
ncbi:hypothetical protein XENTR_v10019774 [Xenopus tropicalis]|nr:hypothetical protein XENTR_v10019774 [Xenopus tropicalis]